jgi:hypothetical protein
MVPDTAPYLLGLSTGHQVQMILKRGTSNSAGKCHTFAYFPLKRFSESLTVFGMLSVRKMDELAENHRSYQ